MVSSASLASVLLSKGMVNSQSNVSLSMVTASNIICTRCRYRPFTVVSIDSPPVGLLQTNEKKSLERAGVYWLVMR